MATVSVNIGKDEAIDFACLHDMERATVQFKDERGSTVDVCMPITLWRAALDTIAEEIGAEREKLRAHMSRSEL